MPNFYLFLSLVLFVVQGETAAGNWKCSRYCKEHSSHKFRPDSTYTYKYFGDLQTSLNTSRPENSVGFQFECVVKVSVVSTCDLLLKIEDVNVKTVEEPLTTKEQQFVGDLKRNPLYFSYQSGRVNTICPTDDEPVDILNVKRAILSVFQTGVSNQKEDALVYETDVSGNCETRYKTTGRSPLTVEKEKNLEACSQRANQYLSWNSVPYNGKSKKKSPPLLKSTQFCTQTYADDGVLRSSRCEERHGFQPLSNGESGAVTHARQRLELLSVNPGKEVARRKADRRTSLLFESKPEVVEEVIEVQSILDLLERLKRMTTHGTEDDTPRLFSTLVYYVRNVDYAKLASICDTIGESPEKRKILLDAISLVSTPAGIKIMRKLYEDGEISEHQINSWITSLAFTKNPSVEVLNEMKPLMTMSSSINQRAILSLSSLVHRFCQMNPQCIANPEIKEIMALIEAPITATCSASDDKNRREILLALKGIGNAGITTSLNILRRCYSNEDLPVELRILALTAHRRFSCSDNKNLDDFLGYFANPNENTEVRIAAYLSSMDCASLATYTHVKDVLHKEETNQVGSFVWTHLTNLQETSSRWKQSLRLLTENYFLRNKFNTDLRKYSRNYEMSSFFDSINAGGTAESNVVFTEDSYLPRSATLNLTLDLFGETVNVFEASARAEGLEDVVERFFGPEGYFPEEGVAAALKRARGEQEKINENVGKIGRAFMRGKMSGDPDVLLSFKAFGNEFAYFGLEELGGLIGEPVTKRTLLDTLMGQFGRQKVDVTKSFVFLDSSIKVPTILGLPLELSVNGTASLGLTAHTNVDLKDFRSMKVAVEGKIYPSAVVEVIGAMTVNSFYTKYGLSLIGKVSSNSYIDGHAFIDKGKLVDVKLNVPKNQFKVFNVQSKIYTVRDDHFNEINNVTDNVYKLNVCSPRNINAITGFEVCSKLTYVNASTSNDSPYFPLTGAFEYSLSMEKVDNFSSYIFNLKSDSNNGKSVTLFFDTPNSRIKRTVLAHYQLDWDNLLINAELSCPFARLELNSNLSNKTNRNIYVQARFNNKELLLFQSSLSSKPYRDSWKYEPLARLRYKSNQVAAVSGSIHFVKGDDYRVDLKLDGFSAEPVSMKGALRYSPGRYEAAAAVVSASVSGNFSAAVLKDAQGFSARLDASYSVRNAKSESVKFGLESRSGERGRQFRASFDSTQRPLYNTLVAFGYEWDDLYFDGSGRLRIFKTTWDSRQRFKFKRTSKHYVDFALLCSLSCREKNINYTIDLSHVSAESNFGAHVLLQLNRRQRLELLLAADGAFSKEKTFLLLAYYPEYTWTLEGNLKEKEAGSYSVSFVGNYAVEGATTKFLTIVGSYVNSSTTAMQNHTVTTLVEFPTLCNSPWHFTTVMQYSHDILLSTSQLTVDSIAYLSHVIWTKNSVSVILQKNDKRLFYVSGGWDRNEFTATVALNVHQHFELNTRLVTPFQSFLFEFYWDKDRSVDRKVSLVLDKDNLGRYTMDLQYPNQKIVAAFVLLPSQVTLNITWGTRLSRKIYLEAGNKVYDVGGIWFAKLETPFEYLENQEFLLHYYVLADSARLKADVKWRNQNVNVQMIGNKSETHITGSVEIKTTLPEIRKAALLIGHLRKSDEIKNEAAFAFNDHEVQFRSLWTSRGLNITSNFEIVSPTGSLLPIFGALVMDNNVTTKFLNCTVNWQQKLMSLDYRFEKPRSHIKIVTPFEGMEETKFDYTLVAEVEQLVLELKANLLRQENWALLSWETEKEAVGVRFQVRSPITGSYRAVFKHSTMFGHLTEYLIVTQGDTNDILALKLYGDLMPVQNLDLNAEAVLLGYTASVSVTNEENPRITTVKARLNNDFIIGKSLVVYDNHTLTSVDLDVTSNILEQSIEFRYKRDAAKYTSLLSLPNGYKFENELLVEGLAFVEDNFNAATPQGNGIFRYSHRLTELDFKHLVLLKYDRKECSYSFYYNLNEYLNLLLDKLELKITTPWYHDVLLEFALAAENLNMWRPSLRFVYDEDHPLQLTSSVRYEPFDSFLSLTVQVSERSVLEFEASYDFAERLNRFRFDLRRPDGRRSLLCDFKVDEGSGLVLIRASNATRSVVDAFFEYDVEDAAAKRVVVNVDVGYEELELRVKANVSLSNVVEVGFDLKGGGLNVDLGVLLGLSTLPHRGFIKYGRNGRFFKVDYDLREFDRRSFVLLGSVTSDFAGYKNATVSFHGERTSKKNRLLVRGDYGKENAAAELVYSLDSAVLQHSYSSKFAAGLQLNCSGGTRPFNVVSRMDSNVWSDRNGSRIDALFKSNIPKLRVLSVIIKSKNSANSHDVDARFNHEGNLYKALYSSKFADKNLTLSTIVETPFFGNISGSLSYQNNKAKIKATYTKNSQIYLVTTQSEFAGLRGNSIFSITTPFNTYIGSLDLDVTGKNRYVYLKLVFPNRSVNLLEIRVGQHFWQSFLVRLHVNLPNLTLPMYTLDLNYNCVAQVGSLLFEYAKKGQKYRVKSAVNPEDFSLTIDVPTKQNYIRLNSTCKSKGRSFSLASAAQISSTEILFAAEVETKNSLKVKADATVRSWHFGDVSANLEFVDDVRFLLDLGDGRSVRFVLDKGALLADRDLLTLDYNGGSILRVWCGLDYSFVSANYKSDRYNFSLAHSSDEAGFTFSKNGFTEISVVGNGHFRGDYCKAGASVILSRSRFNGLNVTANFLKNGENYAVDFNVSNGLRYVFKMVSYFKNESGAYTAFLKLNTAAEFLQMLECFAYANGATFETKFLIAQNYVTREYYGLVDLSKTYNGVLLDFKYPCSMDDCRFYLKYKPSYFETKLKGPGREIKNFSVLATLTNAKENRGFRVRLENDGNYFQMRGSLFYTQAKLEISGEIDNNILEMLREAKLNATHTFDESLRFVLKLHELESKFEAALKQQVHPVLVVTILAPSVSVDAVVDFAMENDYKTLQINSSIQGVPHTLLLELALRPTVKNITAALNAPILRLDFDVRAQLSPTDRKAFIKLSDFLLFHIGSVAQKDAEFMYADMIFNENICNFNVTYDYKTRIFNLTNLKLKNKNDLQIDANGELGTLKGNLKAVANNKIFNLMWAIDPLQNSSYRLTFGNDKKVFGAVIESKGSSELVLKVLTGTAESLLNFQQNGSTFICYVNASLGGRNYYVKSRQSYNFQTKTIGEKVYNIGNLSVHFESPFTDVLSADLEYNINTLDISNLQKLPTKRTLAPCPKCRPSTLSARVTTPFQGYRTLAVTAALHRAPTQLNITFTKDSATTEATLSITASDDAYDLRLRCNDAERPVATAMILLQTAPRRLKGAGSPNFADHRPRTSANLEPGGFGVAMGPRLRNSKLADGSRNGARFRLAGVLRVEQKRDVYFASEFEAGELKGTVNARSARKGGFELVAAVGDRGSVYVGVNETGAKLVLKSSSERAKEVGVEYRFNDSWAELSLDGNALGRSFASKADVTVFGGDHFSTNVDFTAGNLTWRLAGMFDLYKRSQLVAVSPSLNLSAAYNFYKTKKGMWLDSYLSANSRNDTLGFVWTIEPHCEIYLNEHRILQKMTVRNGLIETMVFARIPFFNITRVGFNMTRDVLTSHSQNKFFYNEHYLDLRYKRNFDITVEYYIPVITNHKYLQLQVSYLEEASTLMLKYCKSGVSCEDFTGKYLNNATDFNVQIFRNHIPKLSTSFKKNLEQIHFELNDFITIHLEYNDEFSSKLQLFCHCHHQHKFSVDFDRNEVNLQISTPLLTPTSINIKFKLLNEDDLALIHFSAENDGVVHFGFVFSFERRNRAYVLDVGINACNQSVYASNVKVINAETTEVFATSLILEEKSELYVVLNRRSPYVIGFTVRSPLLPNDGFTVEVLGSELNKLFLFVGNGYSELLKSGVINTASHKDYLLFYGICQNLTFDALTEVSAFRQFNQVKVGLSFLANNEETYFNASINANTELFGNSSFGLHYASNSTCLRALGHLHTLHLDNLDFSVRIPFKITNHFAPKLSLTAFNKTYSAEASYSTVDKKTILTCSYIFRASKLESTFEITFLPNPEVHLDTTCNSNRLQIAFNKNHDGKSLSYFGLNGKKYEFAHAVVLQPNRKLVHVAFAMPTPTPPSNYSLTFELARAPNRTLRLYALHPSFGKEIGFEFSVAAPALADIEAASRVSLPAAFEGFTFGQLLVRHRFLEGGASRSYVLECEARTDRRGLALEVRAAEGVSVKRFGTRVSVDGQVYEVRAESEGSSLGELKGEFTVRSPLKGLEQIGLHLNNSKRDGLRFKGGFDYNFKPVAVGEYSVKNHTHVLEVITPWKSLGGNYRYLNDPSEFHVKGLFYWDKSAARKSQIGGELYLGERFAIGAILPTRTCGLESKYHSDETDEVFAGRLYWNANDSISLKLAFKNRTTPEAARLEQAVALETPFKTLQYFHKMNATFLKAAAVRSLVFFKWDRNPSSEILLDSALTHGNLQTKLRSPLLDHDVALNLSMSDLSETNSNLRIDLEYSPAPDKRLTFETTYQKTYTNVFSTRRVILIRHAASKIDYLMQFGTFRTEDFTNGSFSLRYTDYFTDNPERISAFINIEHKKLAVFGKIATGRNELALNMKSTTEPDLYAFSAMLLMNDKDPLELRVRYKYRYASPSLTTTVSYGNSRSYRMYVGLPSKKEMVASLVHETYGEEFVDSLFAAKLNNSQLLWVKVQWKRDVIGRFYRTLLAEYSDLKFVIEAIGRELIEVIDDDFGGQLVADASYVRTAVSNYAKREVKEWSDGYGKFLDDIKDGVKRNAFYSKKIIEVLKAIGSNFQFLSNVVHPIIDTIKFAYETASYIIHDASICVQYVGTVIHQHVENIMADLRDVRKLKQNAKNMLKMGIEDTQRSLREMQRIALEKLDMLDFYVAEIKQKIEDFFDPCLNVLDDFIVYIEQRLAIMQLVLLDILDTVQSYVANLQEMQDALKAYSMYFGWFEELRLMDLLEPIGNAVECVAEEIVEDVRRVYEDYKPYVDALYDAIFGRYEQLVQLPPISEIRKFCSKIYQKTVWFWKYHNLSETIKRYVRDLFTNLDDFLMILLELENLSGEDFETILQNADYVYKPEQGYIECSLPLVIEWHTFDSLPKFEQHSLYQKIQQKLNHLQQLQGYVMELVNSLRSVLGFSFKAELSPNVNNYAIVIRGTHFITFDGFYFKFAGECSYLLAGDYKSNAFSVVANYDEGRNLKSISVNIYNNTVDLMRDFGVTFNGRPVNLPIVLNSTVVTRNYQSMIVKNSHGLTMVCDYHYDICTIELSRWLFGKTGGLLGTLDNEKVTDLTFPNGTKTSSIHSFVESWKVNTCQTTRTAEKTTSLSPLEEELTDALCDAFFTYRNSPLSDCFHRVNPKPFLDICLTDVRSATDPTVCSAVVAYARMCSSVDITVKIPEMCVNCPAENADIGPTEEIFDGHNPNAMDVVIIHDDNCAANYYPLSSDIEKAITEHGFQSKRYAYIGYGATSEPYLRTSGKEIWSDSSENEPSRERFARTSVGDGESSAIDAIKLALDLDFRPRVTKIFVLLQCQGCPHIDNIPSIYNMLGERDVTLHIITTTPEFGSEYLAIDANGNVMYKNKRGVETKAITTAQSNTIIDEISDSCGLLALGTNGTVASWDDFSSTPGFREKWAEFGMRTISRSPCQKCRCVPDKYGIGKVQCVRCMTPAVKYLLNEYESNIVKYGV